MSCHCTDDADVSHKRKRTGVLYREMREGKLPMKERLFWDRQLLVLDNSTLSASASDEHQTPRGCLRVEGSSQIDRVEGRDGHPWAFEIHSSHARWLLSATSETDMWQWIDALSRAKRPKWVPDAAADACTICKALFNPLRRRHHCRACGSVVCGTCAPRLGQLPALGYGKARVRVCSCVTTDSQFLTPNLGSQKYEHKSEMAPESDSPYDSSPEAERDSVILGENQLVAELHAVGALSASPRTDDSDCWRRTTASSSQFNADYGWDSMCNSKPSEDDLSLHFDAKTGVIKPRSSKDCLKDWKRSRSALRHSENDVASLVAKSKAHLENLRTDNIEKLRLQALREIEQDQSK